MKLTTFLFGALIALTFRSALAAKPDAVPPKPLTEVGKAFEAKYADHLARLRVELTAGIPKKARAHGETLSQFLSNDATDSNFARFVVLLEATPRGLAEFAQQGKPRAALIAKLLADSDLMKKMLIADGAKARRVGRNGYGRSHYGRAMEILAAIKKARSKTSDDGVLSRLALAVSLEHAVPIEQSNPENATNAPATVDAVKRYLHYEKAYLQGELDPTFARLSTWALRFVVNGDEPDETLAWGREMLRNYRPDHIYTADEGWRYVKLVSTDVKYGSENVKHDRPELQRYQNILMNGGVCGRRAFIGRFILRAFGIPTIARPSRGHGALAHCTPKGWVVNLGGGWGAGWTSTRYRQDVDFLATTQARNDKAAYLKVKRAQWAGDVLGEKRIYGTNENAEFWNGVAIKTQRAIIEGSNAVTLAALGEDLGEANEPTVAEKVIASPANPADKKITYRSDGAISIPAAAYSKPTGNTREIIAMKSFGGGLQIFLPRFFPEGKTVLRGGTWKGAPTACTSGKRLLSGGYGRYENWGLRAVVSHTKDSAQPELTLDLGDGVKMELVYIKAGSFVMGGESKTDGRFQCVELPKHDVTLTRGFYLGKYEVTQAQYEAITGSNPSRSTKSPDCPVDNVSETDALNFCGKLAEKTGLDVRLPTEAEWEYASRGGRNSTWFFGEDPTQIGEYAWYKDNARGKSHPVGQKKPNPWGLYDIYGNVCERISDKYSRGYYSISPRVDPTGPSQGTKSRFEYKVVVPQAGDYSITAQVVTAHYNQRLNISAGNGGSAELLQFPFTLGKWQESKPIILTLAEGENTLRFWRNRPPQYGLAIKHFTLTPVK